ncbi:MAG: DUF3127 domain-containing protein [Bacteroidales bacterium]|nr:DUF3127 domain-containing protein [Bacteroidales bacterium]
MALEVEGKFLKTLEPVSGEKNGKKWSKQYFVIEQLGQFVSYAQFQVWNDRINLSQFKEGDMVKVMFDINSREWQERVYTDLTAFRVDKIDGSQPPQGGTQSTQQNSTPTPPPTVPEEQPKAEGGDDLPF